MEGIITLYSNANLVWGNALVEPKQIPGKLDIERFGLFDASSPNYVTFTPGVTPESFIPKDEDFIYPVFRLLSATIINRGWDVIDFTDKKVLAQAIPLIENQPIYPDHEMSIGNTLGVLINPVWQEGYELGGRKIPAGINGVFKIDGIANPRIARLLLMKPPAIHSTSMTLSFTWKKSHEVENFWEKLGSFDENGEMYRRIVTGITNAYEQSLVSHGADAYARILQDGKIMNPNNLRKEKVKTFSLFDYTKEDQLENFSFTLISHQDMDTPIQIPENYQLIMAEFPDLTVDEIRRLNSLDSERASLTDTVSSLTQSLEAYQALGSVEEFTNILATQREALEGLRQEVVSNYKLTVGPGKEDSVILTTLENASKEQLSAFNRGYIAILDEKLPLHCSKCNSTEITRASTVPVAPEKATNVEQKLREKVRIPGKKLHG